MDLRTDPRFRGIEPFKNKVWLSSPTMHGEELQYMTEAYETNWMSTVGENIDALEQMVCTYVGGSYCVALSSGTAALHLAVKLAARRLYGSSSGVSAPDGLGKGGSLYGRRVFCSDMTFAATVNPVVYEGGEPVFIDTEYDTWNMSPEALGRAFEIYPDVKLVVMTHLYGTPGKIGEIREICDAHGALLIEDAAESLGAVYRGAGGMAGMSAVVSQTESFGGRRPAGQTGNSEGHVAACRTESFGAYGKTRQTGSFGDYGVISFNGNKIITGSSGGMLLCRSKEDGDQARKWSTQSRETASWYQHEELGYNYRMSNVVAGVARGQFGYLAEHIAAKKRIYERYREGLKGLPVQMNPFDAACSEPNFWLSCLLVDEDAMCGSVRSEKEFLYKSEKGKSCPDEILEALSCFHAEGRPIWKPMHMQPMYREHGFVMVEEDIRPKGNADRKGTRAAEVYAVKAGVTDVGADIFRRGLCLPSDVKMTEGQQEMIIEVIRRCFQEQ